MTKGLTNRIDLDTLSDWIPVGILETDAQGRCLYVNRALYVILFGTEYFLFDNLERCAESTKGAQDCVANQTWWNWVDPKVVKDIASSWESFVKSGGMFKFECQLHPTLNASTWVLIQFHAMANDQGARYFGTVENISERKALEEHIWRIYREDEEHLAAISAILFSVDSQKLVQRWNTIAEETFGIATADIQGKLLEQCAIAWDWQPLGEAIERCFKDGETLYVDDLAFFDQTATERCLGLTLNPIFSRTDSDDVKGVLILGKDLTEQKSMKIQLMQAQKMESIGQLAAGIAHEINTPIQFVSDNIQFLKESFKEFQCVVDTSHDLFKELEQQRVATQQVARGLQSFQDIDIEFLKTEIPSALEQTIEGVRRVATIVQAMKNFSHPGVEGYSTVDLNENIRDTVTISRNEWKYVAQVSVELDERLPLVDCSIGEVNQVVLNLIVNAAQALNEQKAARPEEGRIRISTQADGKWVELRVSDNAGGIPEEYGHRIFDPFFTTKEVGQGTGQGLSLAHSCVRNHGGTITFDSVLGKGTTFIIRLPIKRDADD